MLSFSGSHKCFIRCRKPLWFQIGSQNSQFHTEQTSIGPPFSWTALSPSSDHPFAPLRPPSRQSAPLRAGARPLPGPRTPPPFRRCWIGSDVRWTGPLPADWRASLGVPALQTPHKILRRRPEERGKFRAGEGNKARNVGPPPFLLGTLPSGPHMGPNECGGPAPLGPPPFGDPTLLGPAILAPTLPTFLPHPSGYILLGSHPSGSPPFWTTQVHLWTPPPATGQSPARVGLAGVGLGLA